ncbi:MAG: hypothetical protein ABIP49_04905, partial [Lysobacterales bacterium]
AGEAKSAEQNASAMGFIVWRVAQNMLKRMRGAQFDVAVGKPYFAFMREVLVFLISVVDRTAYEKMDAASRSTFITALVKGCANTLADNERDLLGPRSDGASHQDSFIDLVNELAPHYAEFGADARSDPNGESFAPDFGFVRYLGSRLEPTLPPKDRHWVIDQVMAIEAPEAVDIVRSAILDLLSTETRKSRRTSMSGD